MHNNSHSHFSTLLPTPTKKQTKSQTIKAVFLPQNQNSFLFLCSKTLILYPSSSPHPCYKQNIILRRKKIILGQIYVHQFDNKRNQPSYNVLLRPTNSLQIKFEDLSPKIYAKTFQKSFQQIVLQIFVSQKLICNLLLGKLVLDRSNTRQAILIPISGLFILFQYQITISITNSCTPSANIIITFNNVCSISMYVVSIIHIVSIIYIPPLTNSLYTQHENSEKNQDISATITIYVCIQYIILQCNMYYNIIQYFTFLNQEYQQVQLCTGRICSSGKNISWQIKVEINAQNNHIRVSLRNETLILVHYFLNMYQNDFYRISLHCFSMKSYFLNKYL
eukprot:TRINITY_DN3388_c0_g1_i6.p1 TRINITY_DN3388_c0_g1~~TRINITY_DN3388_c0_g1_i6.p1  ORF type:complete len:335 (-),score=-24.91 TRINITY_DN3388_c0_g1_i6:224-1228(-)